MNKRERFLFTVRWFVTLGIMGIINDLLQLLELQLYGQIQPRAVDIIIRGLFTFSVWLNVKNWIL